VNKRMTVFIDIFQERQQEARVLRELRPEALVSAIVKEFRGLELLGTDPARYQLVRLDDGTPLDEDRPMDQQSGRIDRLQLVDRPAAPPPSALRILRPVYLRELERGRVYRLDWQPAMIGRRQQARDDQTPLAVNLADHPARDFISKQHVQLIEQGERLMAESLTSKPTGVTTAGGKWVKLAQGKPYPIAHGDVIHLVNSRVDLLVLIVDGTATEKPQGVL